MRALYAGVDRCGDVMYTEAILRNEDITMAIEDQLKEAVKARNLTRHSRYTKTRNLINSFLEQELPEAIRADQDRLKVLVTTLPATSKEVQTWDIPSVSVEKLVWDVLEDYTTPTGPSGKESLMDDYVDDVFKPYLTNYQAIKIRTQEGEDILRLTFFINQG